jgi:D-arabinose 1-dehydrogenase-like Zn-dependent alcohol dehydrogenase
MSTLHATTLPDTAAAAVMASYGSELEIREVRVPRPEPGALVVEVDISTVCGSDVHTWQGAVSPNLPIRPPLVLGHEIVGRVAAIGSGGGRDSVGTPVAVGDRIVWEHEACGKCEMCTVEREPTLCPHRRVGMFRNADEFPYLAGGFAQYSYVWPRAGRIRVPDSVSSEAAAAGSCALRTVVNAFQRLGPIDHTSRVLVQGSGPLGLFAVAMAAWHRPKKLVVVGAPDDRLKVALDWGADAVVSVQEVPDPADRKALVEQLTDGGPDVLLEMSGAPGAFAEGVMTAARNARYVVVGTLGGPAQEVMVSRIVGRGLRIIGCLGADIGSYHRALQFLAAADRELDWTAMFSGRRHGLAGSTDALRSLQGMAEIKPVIDPWT